MKLVSGSTVSFPQAKFHSNRLCGSSANKTAADVMGPPGRALLLFPAWTTVRHSVFPMTKCSYSVQNIRLKIPSILKECMQACFHLKKRAIGWMRQCGLILRDFCSFQTSHASAVPNALTQMRHAGSLRFCIPQSKDMVFSFRNLHIALKSII